MASRIVPSVGLVKPSAPSKKSKISSRKATEVPDTSKSTPTSLINKETLIVTLKVETVENLGRLAAITSAIPKHDRSGFLPKKDSLIVKLKVKIPQNFGRLAAATSSVPKNDTSGSPGGQDNFIVKLKVKIPAGYGILAASLNSVLTYDIFTPFSRLPTELQLKIWKLAAAEGQIVKVITVIDNPTASKHSWSESLNTRSGHPAILRTCRLSRQEGLKIYQLYHNAYFKVPFYFAPTRDPLMIDNIQTFARMSARSPRKLPHLTQDFSLCKFRFLALDGLLASSLTMALELMHLGDIEEVAYIKGAGLKQQIMRLKDSAQSGFAQRYTGMSDHIFLDQEMVLIGKKIGDVVLEDFHASVAQNFEDAKAVGPHDTWKFPKEVICCTMEEYMTRRSLSSGV